jgi:hypothetical protein
MDVRRLVAWISAGILGFQGATLALDLLNCTALSWLYVRRYGLEEGAEEPAKAAEGRPVDRALRRPLDPDGTQGWDSASLEEGQTPASTAAISAPGPHDPVGVFCKRPHDRIDAGVSQGLSILAGLALGGSVGSGGGRGESP